MNTTTTTTEIPIEVRGEPIGQVISIKSTGVEPVIKVYLYPDNSGEWFLDEATAIRAALTKAIGDYKSYDPEVWEPDQSCPHRIPCGGPCQSHAKLQRKR